MAVFAERFRRRYGPWALVAGGTDGIGAEFARRLAGFGLNLLVVGRRLELLASFTEELSARYSVEARPLCFDLASSSDVAALIEASKSCDVGLLVCNAAQSVVGSFLDQSFESHERLIDLNCRMPALLAHEFGRRMKEAARGGIILLSSMASFQGTAMAAHYAASKAYIRVLAEGLWAELGPFGIDVLASCPGTVDTPTFHSDQPVVDRGLQLPVLDAKLVVDDAMRALGRRPEVVPGGRDRIAAFFMLRVLSRKRLIRMTAKSMHAMYPHLDGRPGPAAR
ncbi:MAG TPA: SDR family NAD(P)-dependent oxidoreductase [Spirochaetia bacterium]|nr:SDR family NAD(P)-dependent oxidoreductase [Spirochaetia bacterium]